MSESPPPKPNANADLLAAAAEKRAQSSSSSGTLTSIQEYEKRQNFRRLIDPGILRPNSKETATASLKTLLTISENLLREPSNPKFQQFKTTNDTIKRRLIEPKGALEYAIALGFQPEVQDFQPYYCFNARKIADLHIGAAILKEAIELDTQKQKRLERSRREEKAAAAAVANNVKLAFLDDRKTKMRQDQRDRERREAHAAAAARGEARSLTPETLPRTMPGSGHLLVAPEFDPTIDNDDIGGDDGNQ